MQKKSLIAKLAVIAALTAAFLSGAAANASAAQNPYYPSPAQCKGDDWNIGLPDGITCGGSVTTGGWGSAMENDSKATSVFGASSRLKPDLASLNKFCQQYTGDSSSYATYGRMHNYCSRCNQNISWFTGSAWVTQQVCHGTLNVQQVTCATQCKTPEPPKPPKVTCSCDADCGKEGFAGSTYCKSGDVYKNYKEFVCKNPGTKDSYCDKKVTPIYWYGCGKNETCSDGYCIDKNPCGKSKSCW